MGIKVPELTALLQTAFPDAVIEAENFNDDGRHYAVSITSSAFAGLSKIKQHQLVYKALGSHLQNDSLHALMLTTKAP